MRNVCISHKPTPHAASPPKTASTRPLLRALAPPLETPKSIPPDQGPGRAQLTGRVGVAHATRKCALVRNISQAWGSNPPAWSIFKGWGTPSRQGPDQGVSLGWGQWPSCLTTPATSLSCPHSSSRRSPWPSRRGRAYPSGRTSRFGEPRQPPTTRCSASPPRHGAADSDVQTSPRHPRRGAAFYLAIRQQAGRGAISEKGAGVWRPRNFPGQRRRTCLRPCRMARQRLLWPSI